MTIEPLALPCGDETAVPPAAGQGGARVRAVPLVPELESGFARRHGVMLACDGGARLRVALREGADPDVVFEVQRHFGRPFDVRILTAAAFDDPAGPAGCATGSCCEPAVAERLLRAIVGDAVRRGATHVHLEPCPTGMRVRLRVAGVLVEALHLGASEAAALAAVVCARAGLRDDGRAGPRQGAIRFAADAHLPELAVETLPAGGGERILLRPAGRGAASDPLAALGMAPPLIRALRRVLALPGGILLVTGPAASGKTATLHALARDLAAATRNILAVEERLETMVDGVTQTVADPARGFPVADAVRAAMRQDPDVVLVGNLPDRAAAAAALAAAEAGHLVLAGIEAPDAVGAILALRAMKVDPFLLASTLHMVLAQRLVRRLCPDCRRPVQAQGSVSALLGFDPGAIVYAAEGCGTCRATGFAGNIGVFEAVRVDAAIRRLISDGGDEAILARHAFVNAPNLGSAARALVRDGVTTPEEAVRVTRSGGSAGAR